MFGNIKFEVSDASLISPNNISIKIGNNTTKHNVVNSPDITEFKKRNLKTVSFNLKLHQDFNDIEEVRENLINICENGEAYPLVIGDLIFDNLFILTSLSENIKYTDGNGNALVSEFSVSFEEYIDKIERTDKDINKIEQKHTSLKTEKTIKNINKIAIKKLKGALW